MAADNIGGAVDVTDPRDLADLGDEITPDDKEKEIPAPSKGKEDSRGDLPLEEDENEEEETNDIEDIDETKEDENKEDEVSEDVEEEVEVTASTHERPSFKEISTKYPKFFKEFPAVREALGRELAYTQVFPTVDDAKEAGEVIQNFSKLEETILNGDPSLLLGSLHNKSEQAVNKFAKNFLPTIQKGNPKLFFALITPYINKILRNALDNANSADNKDLAKSVRWLARYIHGTEDGSIPEDPKIDEGDENDGNEEVTTLREQNKDLAMKSLRRFGEDVKDYTEKILEREILKNVDPEDALPSFMREALVGKIIRDIQVSLNSDASHTKSMTALWQKASKNGYSKEDRSQLITAFLARARKILPSIRDKHKKEVMKKLTSKGREERIPNNNRRRIPESGAPASRNSNPKSKDINWRATSDEDILNDKFVPNRR